jgi:uncharacterized membrane protein
MADPTTARRRALMLVVLGIIAFAVIAYLLVAWQVGGDNTHDEIDPQNGEVVTLFPGL